MIAGGGGPARRARKAVSVGNITLSGVVFGALRYRGRRAALRNSLPTLELAPSQEWQMSCHNAPGVLLFNPASQGMRAKHLGRSSVWQGGQPWRKVQRQTSYARNTKTS